MRNQRICVFLAWLFLLPAAFAQGAPFSPLTSIAWEATLQDVIALEGEEYGSYDSVYGGKTYTYDKLYNGGMGQIKYMFDAKEQLMSVAWLYEDASASNVMQMYDELHEALLAEHGQSDYGNSNATNTGDAWYLDDCHILLNVLTLDTMSALQFTYMRSEDNA